MCKYWAKSDHTLLIASQYLFVVDIFLAMKIVIVLRSWTTDLICYFLSGTYSLGSSVDCTNCPAGYECTNSSASACEGGYYSPLGGRFIPLIYCRDSWLSLCFTILPHMSGKIVIYLSIYLGFHKNFNGQNFFMCDKNYHGPWTASTLIYREIIIPQNFLFL